jgi:protein TonB
LVGGLHLLLGAVLVHGLAGNPLRGDELAPPRPLEVALATLTLEQVPVRPVEAAPAARKAAGAPDLKARPAPIVVPPPRVLPARNPIATADDEPGVGAAPSAGAGNVAGPGRGAGGTGEGSGGGGSGGDGAGSGNGLASEARLLSGNLTRRDYSRIRSFGSPQGRAVLGIEVSAEGRVIGCQPLTGSGSVALDLELCRLLSRTRWEPARDLSGRPVLVALRYVATWERL